MKRFTNDIVDIQRGNTDINKVYRGENLVWERGEPDILPLDLLDNDAYFAYSLRKLRSAYTGSAIRVRRGSDNTEQDIGFDVNGELDTTALLSFVGSGNGFVRTWYDQSGSRDAGNTTTGQQPRIVNIGVVHTLEGKPTVAFQGGVRQLFLNSSISAADSLNTTAFVIGRGGLFGTTILPINSPGSTITGPGNGSYNLRFFGSSTSTLRVDLVQANIAQHIVTETLPIFSGVRIATMLSGATNRTLSVTGGAQIDTVTSVNNTNTRNFSNVIDRIGRNGGTATDQFIGSLSELIFCPGDKSSAREDIQASFFNYIT